MEFLVMHHSFVFVLLILVGFSAASCAARVGNTPAARAPSQMQPTYFPA
jgi:hypothetical protein